MPSESPASQPPHQPAPASTGTEVIYREKLWPALWIWAVVAGTAGATVVAFIPINPLTGILTAAGVGLVLVVLLLLSTPAIVVTPTTLQVGRASIERRYVGDVTGYRGDEATEQRGPGLNGIAYLCIRGWISPVVRIEITDATDRTPYWLTSTRRPERLVAALGTAPGK